MQRARERGTRPTPRGRGSGSVARTLAACLCGLFTALSGCNMAQRNDRGRETPPDPLKGEMVPKGYAPGVGPVASGATTKSKTGVPPLPAATSSPSPAEIVQRGPPDPLYGEQPSLAIGKTTGPTQPVASWQPNGPSGVLASGQGGAPPVGASLQEPVPMVAPR